MSEKVEELLSKPDSEQLFDEIETTSDKLGIHNSDLLSVLMSGHSIKKTK